MATADIDAIISAVWPVSERSAAGGIYARQVPLFEAELESGVITQYSGSNPADCAQARGYTPTGVAIGARATQAAGIATTGISTLSKFLALSSTIPVIGQIVGGVASLFTSVFSAFSAHHAQAVAREQGTLCAIIPQVNLDFTTLDSEVSKGTISAAEADAELDRIVSDYHSATATITQEGPGKCNAGCVMGHFVEAEALLRKEKYKNSSLYYIKRYWWVGALGFVAIIFIGRK